MSLKTILGVIFASLGVTTKPDVNFFTELFELLFSIQGRVNFWNLSRYSTYNESTFRRRFAQFFDWLNFNCLVTESAQVGATGQVIGVIDCSFISKSGKKTFGLDTYWSGCAAKSKRGLEISVLGVIDVVSGRAWTLDVTQTPAHLATKEAQVEVTPQDKAKAKPKIASAAKKAEAKMQLAAQKAEAKMQLAAQKAEAKMHSVAQKAEAKMQLAAKKAEAKLKAEAKKAEAKLKEVGKTKEEAEGKTQTGVYTRIDFYFEQIVDCLPKLLTIKYFVADGFYAKYKMIHGLLSVGKHLITKLRPDANLMFKFEGSQEKRQGPPNKYAGKAVYNDLSKWHFIGKDAKYDYLNVYHRICYSPQFGVWLSVALVLNTKTNQYILLASTDLEQSALDILTFYQLRFQIEFLFRDAKQFTGLTHCQARDEAKLDFHFNLSLAAINVIQLLKINDPSITSMNALTRKAYNTKIVKYLLDQLSLNAEFDLSNPLINNVINFGTVF